MIKRGKKSVIDERKKGRKQRGREISVEGGKKETRESLQKKNSVKESS